MFMSVLRRTLCDQQLRVNNDDEVSRHKHKSERVSLLKRSRNPRAPTNHSHKLT